MKVLTANRLADGVVVFLGPEGWTERFAQAEIFHDEAAAAGAESEARGQIAGLVDPYLIDVAAVQGGWAPVSYRERLRALGPTNRTDHGKQAEGGADIAILAQAVGAARSTGRVNLIKRK